MSVPFSQENGLGNRIESALKLIGIDSALVESWVGVPCGCEERRDKLNQLGFWAARILKGKTERAREYLAGIIGGR